MTEKIRYYDNTVFEINPITIGHDPRTTLMIKNIPNKYTIEDLSNEIDQNYMNSYDFLYLPCDIKVILFFYSRITVTSGMDLSTLSTPKFYMNFTADSIIKNGSSLEVIKYNFI